MSLHILMDKTGVDLNGRVSRVVILVGDGLGCQPLDVQALCRLQQRWQLRVIDADLAAINKLQQRLQIARRNAGQHHDRMLACCILRKKSGEQKYIKVTFHGLRCETKIKSERASRQHFTAIAHIHSEWE